MNKFIFIIIILASIIISCNSLHTNLQKLRSNLGGERCEAIYWLYFNIKGKTTQKLIINALIKDKSELVRSLAARLMGIDGNKNYIPLLENALTNDKSYLVRMEAAQSLGSLLAKKSIKKLEEQLKKDNNSWVKLKILKTFEYMNAKQAVPFLIKILDDQEPAVRFQALRLLEKFTGEKVGLDKQSWLNWYEKLNKVIINHKKI